MVNEPLEARLSSLSVMIVSHIGRTGPAHELEHYLAPRVARLLFIGHPLELAEKRRSFSHVRLPDGRMDSRRDAPGWLLSESVSAAMNVCLTLWWGVRERKADLYVGLGGVNAFCGLLLRALGRVETVVFWTIDYVPQRFKNPLLNWIYHSIDVFCVKHCDRVWNLGARMAPAREGLGGVSPAYRKKQITVPMGTDLVSEPLPSSEIDRFTIAYMGGLRENQGVEALIEAMPHVIRMVPEARLLIIGGGPRGPTLKALRMRLGLEEHVEFTGVIEDHQQLLEKLSRCALGVAPYGSAANSYTRFTDPGKPKAYLSVGLPVVITPVPAIAHEIEERGAGLLSGHEPHQLAEAIVRLLTAPDYEGYRQRARAMAQDYAWPRVFSEAFSETL